MERTQRLLLLTVLTAAAAIIVLLAAQSRAQAERYQRLVERSRYPVAGFYVPPVNAVNAQGEIVQLGAPPEGERQLLFFLTTTCTHCLATLPVWEELASAARAHDAIRTSVYAISHDPRDATDSYAATHRLTFPVLVWADARQKELYRAGDVPLTILIGSDGRVRVARPGRLHAGSAAVDSLLTALRTPDQPRTSSDTTPASSR